MSHRDRRIAALAALAGFLFPTTAHAVTTVGGGVLAGISFHHRPSFALTIQAYVTEGWDRRSFQAGCYSSPRAAVGPIGAVSFVKGGPRLIAAVIGGGDVSGVSEFGAPSLLAGGEVGAVWGAGGEPGVGLHLGAHAGLSVLTAAARVEAFEEASVSAGLWYAPPYGQHYGCAVPGRPLRDSEGRRVESVCADEWSRRAQDEASSVLAFLDLAQALLEQDAPAELIDRALRSAEDEIAHALLCRAEGGAGPTLPLFAPRARLPRREALVRIATESFHDGWINEGLAAREALVRSRVAGGSARRALAIIARDEARHARLGRAVAQWAIERGGRIDA
jgi:hypothetical protein